VFGLVLGLGLGLGLELGLGLGLDFWVRLGLEFGNVLGLGLFLRMFRVVSYRYPGLASFPTQESAYHCRNACQVIEKPINEAKINQILQVSVPFPSLAVL
jgi:hypothetical protein